MIDDFDLEKINASESRGMVEEALARIERATMGEIEAGAVRVPVFEALKQLIVTGNALVYMPKKEGMKVFRMDRYVVSRDTMGNVLEIIIKESVSPLMLSAQMKEELADKIDNNAKSIDLYTKVCRRDKKWEVYQEAGGVIVPESEGTFPLDKNPFIPLRFIRVDGEDYGRGFVEEYFGDLKSLEALTKAIVEGASASAKVLFMVRPNSTTKARVLAESPNGAIVSGDANDVSTLQVQKGGDFRVAMETASTITDRLSYAFLLNSAATRNAERVTAEEVRYMAQELESALGGVYSILSQEFQLPLITLLLHRMEGTGKMPKMPKGMVKPTIVTGIEALGRGQDLNKLAMFLQHIQPLGPEVIGSQLNVGDYIARLGASLGIDMGGLIKSQEQLQQEAEAAQAQQQEMMAQQQMGDMATKAAPQMLQGAIDNPEMVQAMAEQIQE
tara:strand:+ start:17 stop:1348 length:1332 start_codon:yes stop_codon:yes gene_type:complete